MPLLNVVVTGHPNPSRSAAIASTLTDLTTAHLGKDPAVTAVAVQYLDDDHWFVGNRALSVDDVDSFSLHIRVTEGTNSKQQIAAYIKAVFSAMTKLLGGIRDESYVVVDEVPAAAWGYAGKTQELRSVASGSNLAPLG